MAIIPEPTTAAYRFRTMIVKEKYCDLGRAVIAAEVEAIQALSQRIDESFARACSLILSCTARTVVTGMGKSGHIARKIAATLASTGTPAFFVHPGDAVHGDIGMITANDCVIAISNSGETPEVLQMLAHLKQLKIPLISLTGKKNSTLAKAASTNLDISVDQEACPLGLAPTSSTTTSLVMGDALAVALLEARGFTATDFARSHPGGTLGRRLLLRVDDIMHSGTEIPRVTADTPLKQTLLEMTQKRLGLTAITDAEEKLLGVFTDGDLRRTMDQNYDLSTTLIKQVMTPKGVTLKPSTLAMEALTIMQQRKITAIFIVDETDRLAGVIHMHDLLRAGIA